MINIRVTQLPIKDTTTDLQLICSFPFDFQYESLRVLSSEMITPRGRRLQEGSINGESDAPWKSWK